MVPSYLDAIIAVQLRVEAEQPLYTTFSQALNGHAPRLRGGHDPPSHPVWHHRRKSQGCSFLRMLSQILLRPYPGRCLWTSIRFYETVANFAFVRLECRRRDFCKLFIHGAVRTPLVLVSASPQRRNGRGFLYIPDGCVISRGSGTLRPPRQL